MTFLYLWYDSEKKFLINLEANFGEGTPLQYSCLENPTDGEAW